MMEFSRIVGLLLGFFVFALNPVWAEIPKVDVKKALEERLSFIFNDEKLSKTQIGIEVFSLSQQETLYKRGNELALSPASAVKVLTGLVALKRLGPDFVFKTEVLTDGKIENGILNGNLYLRGGGDPSLVTERLFLLASDLRRHDFRKINGSLIIDDWTFDQIAYDAARIPTKTDRAYNAPVGGISFNYNTTTVYFRPGKQVGDPIKVFVEPDTGFIQVQNSAKTSKRGSAYKVVASRLDGKDRDTLVVSGSMPEGLVEQRSYFNVTDPVRYSGMAFKMMLEKVGIDSAGLKIEHRQVPVQAKLLSSLDSLPLREIVVLMNKFSNNFIADTLIKTLGRELKGAPGEMKKGLQVLWEEATRLNINSAGFDVVSGSGLTRENRMTARQFVTLLNAAYRDFDVLPELLSSLPIAGRDGTLRSRLKGTSANGRLRAKTGSIDGVSSLVGVVQSQAGELLAFAVIMNDKSKNPGSMHPWQNYFGQALADFNRRVPLKLRPDPMPSVLVEPQVEDSTAEIPGPGSPPIENE